MKKIIIPSYFILALLFVGLTSLSSCGDNEDLVDAVNSLCPDGVSCFIFVSSTTSSPDLDLNDDSNAMPEADAICNADSNKPTTNNYKAMITSVGFRTACTTANCGGGPGEHLDWVLEANRVYKRTADGATIGTTTANGIFTFPLDNAISPTDVAPFIHSGISADWTTLSNCSNWTTTVGTESFANEQSTTSTSIDSSDTGCVGSSSLYCVEQP